MHREYLQQQQRRRHEVHELADRLRFVNDISALPLPVAVALESRCRWLWERRGENGATWVGTIRNDFIDLVSLWGALQIRLSQSRFHAIAEAARLQPEAERLTGSTGTRTAWQHSREGRALLGQGKLDQAAEILARSVRMLPDSFWPNFHQGTCAYRRGRHQDAATAFSVCVELSPQSAPCHLNRAVALSELGRLDEARADLDRAVALDPNLGAAWLQRGVAHAKMKRWDDAEADLLSALQHGADGVRVHTNLAVVYREKGDLVRARSHQRKAKE